MYIPPAVKTSGLLARAMTRVMVACTPGSVDRPPSQPEQYAAAPMFWLYNNVWLWKVLPGCEADGAGSIPEAEQWSANICCDKEVSDIHDRCGQDYVCDF